VHMTETQCLEVIVVKGDVNNLRNLTEKIMSLKGVEHVKLTSTGIKEN
jgi:CopG family nickel-responsive transcriptional regulator